MGDCDRILASATELLHFVRSPENQAQLHGYLIHCHVFPTTEATTSFWQTQFAIITQMRLINHLCLVVAFIHPDHDGRSVAGFKQSLKRAHWLVTSTPISFPSVGDSISGHTSVVIAVHSSTTPAATALELRQPPTLPHRPITDFIWEPFNTPAYAVASSSSQDNTFENLDTTLPSSTAQDPSDLTTIKFFLHRRGTEPPTCNGAAVLDLRGCCPGRLSSPNQNLFQHFFGIEYIYSGRTLVRPISQFEVAACFRLRDSITYPLAHPTNRIHLDAGIPALTSAWVFEHVLERLLHIREANTEFYDPSPTDEPHTDSVPTTLIHAFVNGTVTTRLPSRDRWRAATLEDEELTKVRQMVLSPSMITKENLKAINYNYRHAVRNSLISIEDGLLIYREPIVGGVSYTRLTIVPSSLRNIIFVAFHTNPAGGHLNVVRTLHRIRLRYFWHHMYRYIEQMCAACPGCALANRTNKSKSSELIYNFPIEAPFMVMFCDAYSAGSYSGFEGSETYLIACCGMCSFACMEPVSHATAESFASAIMKIQLRFGLCHTIVIDKDSKFLSVFRESMELLKINFHMLSGDNHNPMLVKRIN